MLSTCTSPPARAASHHQQSLHPGTGPFTTAAHGHTRTTTVRQIAGRALHGCRLGAADAVISVTPSHPRSPFVLPCCVALEKKEKSTTMQGEATEGHAGAGAADASAALQKGTCTFLLCPRSIVPLQLLRHVLALVLPLLCPPETH